MSELETNMNLEQNENVSEAAGELTAELEPGAETVKEETVPVAVVDEGRGEGEKAAEARASWTPRPEPKLGRIVDSENDMVYAEMPEDRRKEDEDEIRRAIAQRKILTCRIDSEVPMGDDSVKITGHRKSIRIIFMAEDFFKYSRMKDMDGVSPRDLQTFYRRKVRRMYDAYVTFIPVSLQREKIPDENGKGYRTITYVIGSRGMAMERQREKHFFGRNADVELGTRTTASVLSTGPDYVVAEAFGIECTIGAGELAAFEYIEDVSEKFAPGMGIAVAVSSLEVDRENKTVDMRLSHSLLERLSTPREALESVYRGGTYSARVLSEHPLYYEVLLIGYCVRGRISRSTGNMGGEMLRQGDRVTMKVHGHDFERGYVWGSCYKV